MGYGIGEVGAVQGVEVELVDPALFQTAALVGHHRRSHQLACFRVVIEALEKIGQPVGYLGAAKAGKFPDLCEIRDRQEARDDRHGDPGRAGPVQKPEIVVNIEEKLGDGAAGPTIDFALEIVEIGLGAGRRGVGFGIGGNGNLEIAHRTQPRHQVRGIGETLGIGHVGALALRRIAAQGDDMTDSGVPVFAGNLQNLIPRGADAGEMGGGGEICLLEDAHHGGMGAFARAATRAIGHGDKAGLQRRQAADRGP